MWQSTEASRITLTTRSGSLNIPRTADHKLLGQLSDLSAPADGGRTTCMQPGDACAQLGSSVELGFVVEIAVGKPQQVEH